MAVRQEAIAINQQWNGHPGMWVEEVQGPGAIDYIVIVCRDVVMHSNIRRQPESSFCATGPAPLNKVQLWMKPLQHPAGSMAVFVLNYCAVPQNYTIVFSKILALSSTASGNGKYDNSDISSTSEAVPSAAPTKADVIEKENVQLAVRDVWRRTDNGTVSARLALTVPGYDSFLLRLSRVPGG
eukprot:COSAG02_NODE_6053_length_3840_cov_2.507618_2_plen_183_part_00